MKKGNVVTIYEDPITEKVEEGDAELVKRLKYLSDDCEYWKVRFLDGYGDICHRFIKKNGKNSIARPFNHTFLQFRRFN